MKRTQPPSTPKRLTLVQAMKQAGERTPRKRLTIKERIVAACGKELPLMIEMMTDKDTSGAYIHRVLTNMGIHCTYQYVQQYLREQFAAEYGWFQDIVDEDPRPLVHYIPRSAFDAVRNIDGQDPSAS